MKKNTFFETLAEPFTGWKFLVYLGFAFVPWVIIKEVLNEQGVILGGVFATLLLVVIAGIIGLFLGFLNKNANKIPSENEITDRTNSFFKRHRRAIVLVILFAVLGGWWLLDQSEKRDAELACLQEIEYRGSTYRIWESGSTHQFKTQSEAMNYCLKVIRPWE